MGTVSTPYFKLTHYPLRNQLVGQYLRHDSCRAGCLLLTYHGKPRWRHPRSRAHLGFHDVIRHLRQMADAIEAEQKYRIRLSVHGLDLTDPELPPAHKP